MIDGHMHLENGPLTKEYVLEFVEEAHKKGIDKIQILDHTHRFIEFEPIYMELKDYEVQKTWLENKKMKFKDHLADFVNLMEDVKAMDLPIKVTYGLEVCYVPQHEEFIRNILSQYHFDFLGLFILSMEYYMIWDFQKLYYGINMMLIIFIKDIMN